MSETSGGDHPPDDGGSTGSTVVDEKPQRAARVSDVPLPDPDAWDAPATTPSPVAGQPVYAVGSPQADAPETVVDQPPTRVDGPPGPAEQPRTAQPDAPPATQPGAPPATQVVQPPPTEPYMPPTVPMPPTETPAPYAPYAPYGAATPPAGAIVYGPNDQTAPMYPPYQPPPTSWADSAGGLVVAGVAVGVIALLAGVLGLVVFLRSRQQVAPPVEPPPAVSAAPAPPPLAATPPPPTVSAPAPTAAPAAPVHAHPKTKKVDAGAATPHPAKKPAPAKK
jgi:hypothetical protein